MENLKSEIENELSQKETQIFSSFSKNGEKHCQLKCKDTLNLKRQKLCAFFLHPPLRSTYQTY